LPIYQKSLKFSKSINCKVTSKIPTQLITIGDHLRKRRIELDLFQKDVAKIIDVSEDCITFWEKGRSKPQRRCLDKITLFRGYNPFQKA